jgi:hypothetical protein
MWESRCLTTLGASTGCYRVSLFSLKLYKRFRYDKILFTVVQPEETSALLMYRLDNIYATHTFSNLFRRHPATAAAQARVRTAARKDMACANLSEQMDTWYPKWQVTSDYRCGLIVCILVPYRCRAWCLKWAGVRQPRCLHFGTVEQPRTNYFCPYCLSFFLSFITRYCLEICNRNSVVSCYQQWELVLLKHVKLFNSENLESARHELGIAGLSDADLSKRALVWQTAICKGR